MGRPDTSTQAISVIKDESGLLFLGEPGEIKQWLDERGITSREFTTKALKVGANAAQAAGELAQGSGRWVKLTKESSQLLKQYGKAGALQKGVAQGANGRIVKWLEFTTPSQLFSPAMATGVAGVMAQAALEQAIQEITDYLASIDKKVDELLQDQKDRSVSDLIGVALEIDEAEAIWKKTGALNETAWSKLSPCAKTTTQALGYALLKLKGLSDKLVAAKSAEEIDDLLKPAGSEVDAWLTVIARAVQTRDRFSVLELERAYAELPEVLEQHRLGITEARKLRLQKIKDGIVVFQKSIDDTAARLREQKLLHPFAVDSALSSAMTVAGKLSRFAEYLDIEIDEHEIERARDWGVLAGEAAADVAKGIAKGAGDLGGAAMDGANQLGGVVMDGAGKLGDAMGEGFAAAASSAVAGGQQIAEALGNVDLGKIAEALPWKRKK